MVSKYLARDILYQFVALFETKAGHKPALKYIRHTLMGRGCGQALKYCSDTSPVNGRPLWCISFWRISPV